MIAPQPEHSAKDLVRGEVLARAPRPVQSFPLLYVVDSYDDYGNAIIYPMDSNGTADTSYQPLTVRTLEY